VIGGRAEKEGRVFGWGVFDLDNKYLYTRYMAKKIKDPLTGRKSKSFARKREVILKAALTVFAREGVKTTMEDVADEAQIAMSTLYEHFKDKNDLITSTANYAFNDWEWLVQQRLVGVSDPLEQFVLPMRLFLRAKQTHPEYANFVAKNFAVISQILPSLSSNMSAHLGVLIKAKILQVENPSVALQNLMSILTIQMINQTNNPKATFAEADLAIRIALPMLGISKVKAEKLTKSRISL
jgi:AcrR family transcriptional regulator